MNFDEPKNPPDIFIQNLTLSYQQRHLFQNFNLHLPAGSWSCLLGPSGVGKSTLLKFIAGLPTGVDKSISHSMIRTSDNHALQGRMSYMAQQDLLMPWLSILENCLLGYRLRNEKKLVMERALKLLNRVGLSDALNLRISQLSGGMRQRVALVRTLLEDRPIILMDEPFSALDFIARLQLQDLAVELLAGKTVLQVTHDPLEAVRLADNIVIFRDSPIQQCEQFIINIPRPRGFDDLKTLKKQNELLKLLTSKK